MASLWQAFREELQGTITDFKEKGAIGALRDATLDAVDIIQDAGGAIVDSTSKLLSGSEPTLHVAGGLPEVGDKVKLSMTEGPESAAAEVLAIDGISQPPRARVRLADSGEELLVDVVDAGPQTEEREPEAENSAGPLPGQWVIDELGNQLREAVEEVREKGPGGALKDAALDTVDIVTQGATAALDGAQELGRKSLKVLSGEEPEPKPVEPLAPSNPTLEQMYEDQLSSTPERGTGGYGGPTPVAMSPTPVSPKAVPKLNLSTSPTKSSEAVPKLNLASTSPTTSPEGVPKLNLSEQQPEEFSLSTARGPAATDAQPTKTQLDMPAEEELID